jgi:UrcA family protein
MLHVRWSGSLHDVCTQRQVDTKRLHAETISTRKDAYTMTTITKLTLRNLLAPAAFAVITATAAAAPAVAEVPGHAVSEPVKYGDLDLTHPTGVNALYNRIRSASKVVCAQLSSHAVPVQLYDACITKAMSQAVADVNHATLTALYLEKSGNSHSQRLAMLDKR